MKRNILSSYQENLVNTNIELLVIRIHYTNNKSLLFTVFYRPPSSDEEYLEQLQENMNSLEQNTDIILVGDFNLKEVDWNRNLMLNNSRLYEIFSDILLDNFLTQMVLQPTRAGNILDLVQSNSTDIIQDVQVGETISDHNVLTFNANVYPYRRKHTKKEFYNFKKAD